MKAKAHTNIALIKYWGKKDKALKIPHNSSISLTLDAFYTETEVIYDDSLTQDVFYLDGQLTDDKVAKRVRWFMDQLRERYTLPGYAYIYSENHVPKEAGLASSASAFAALASAATAHLDLDTKTLSRLARLGSGSASRSIYPDFVKWEQGNNDLDSFASPLDVDPWPDFRMVVCMVNDGLKPYPSSEAMDQTVEESVYYDAWVAQSHRDAVAMEAALKQHDIWRVGQLAQENALRMHASLMAINKWYFEPETIEIMNIIRDLQKEIPVFFTMDAGPNVKIVTLAQYIPQLLDALPKHIKTIECKAGEGVVIDAR